jgi:hypothetical protein
VFLVLVVEDAGSRSRDGSYAGAFASSGERPDRRSTSRGDSDAFGGIDMAAMAYGSCSTGARSLAGSHLRGIIRPRVTHHGRGTGVYGSAQKHSGREHQGE